MGWKLVKLEVQKNVMQANNEIAEGLRVKWAEQGLIVLNIISSPGSGKTALLEQTLQRLQGRVKAGVLVGDIQTENDAVRLSKYGFPVKQIITSGTCHLEAHMIEKNLPDVQADSLELLIIENVGNLVCPSSYDLGEDLKVVALSVTEGEDKPLKYPGIFRRAKAAVITKVDLLPYLDFDMTLVREHIHTIHPDLDVLELSSKSGEGVDRWIDWLLQKVAEKRREQGSEN
jgi:hydrogenase nickel incorporation protein HypB